MPLFLSTATNRVDKKGRISVPAAFRAVLPTGGFQGIVAYQSFRHPCIHGADLGFMEQLSNSIHSDFGLYSDENEALANAILASARQLPFDPEGRVIIPKDLLDHGEITDEATFVGLGKTFQIWQPEAYAVYREAQRSLAETTAAALRPIVSRSPSAGDGQ